MHIREREKKYNTAMENSIIDRESLRHMALAQVYGSSCYSQTSKERLRRNVIAPKAYSPRCYSAAIPTSRTSCASIPQGIGLPYDAPIGTHASILHSEAGPEVSTAYWVEQSAGWPCTDQSGWKGFSQLCPINYPVTQGINSFLFLFILQTKMCQQCSFRMIEKKR